MTNLKTIRVKSDTFDEFRRYGIRTQSDDDILKLLMKFHKYIADKVRDNPFKHEEVHTLDNLLNGNGC